MKVLALGCFTGILFINLRILPMVLGLGISLVYECMSFSMYDQQGLNLFGKNGVAILSDKVFIVVVALLVIGVMTYMFQYSSFGYNRRAIQGNQKLANDSGINIYVNAVLCYTLAGALVAVAGVFDTAYKSNLHQLGKAGAVVGGGHFLGLHLHQGDGNSPLGKLIRTLT